MPTRTHLYLRLPTSSTLVCSVVCFSLHSRLHHDRAISEGDLFSVAPMLSRRPHRCLLAHIHTFPCLLLPPSSPFSAFHCKAGSTTTVQALRATTAPQWTEWGACTKQCNGVQYRFCGSSKPHKNSVDCVGEAMRKCNQPGAFCPGMCTHAYDCFCNIWAALVVRCWPFLHVWVQLHECVCTGDFVTHSALTP